MSRDAVHHRLEILLLEREAAERGDRGLLARLARDRLLRRALRGDVLHVRVEPAVAAAARHEDRVDGGPDDLAVGAHVALDELLVRRRRRARGRRPRGCARCRPGASTSAGVRPISSSRAAAEQSAERVVDLEPAPVGADDRHADRRVGEAAPEAVLARPPQRRRGGARTARARCCRRRRRASGRRARRRRRRPARPATSDRARRRRARRSSATSADRVALRARPRRRTARGRRRTARTRSWGRRSRAASPRSAARRRAITPASSRPRRAVEPAREQQRRERPTSRRRARRPARRRARSGMRQRDPDEHHRGAARDQPPDRPRACASPGRLRLHRPKLPDGEARCQASYARGASPTRAIQARRSGWRSSSVIRSCSTWWKTSSSSGSIATA